MPARIDLRVSLERRCSAAITLSKERSALSRFRSPCCTDSRRVKPIALASAGEKKESRLKRFRKFLLRCSLEPLGRCVHVPSQLTRQESSPSGVKLYVSGFRGVSDLLGLFEE